MFSQYCNTLKEVDCITNLISKNVNTRGKENGLHTKKSFHLPWKSISKHSNPEKKNPNVRIVVFLLDFAMINVKRFTYTVRIPFLGGRGEETELLSEKASHLCSQNNKYKADKHFSCDYFFRSLRQFPYNFLGFFWSFKGTVFFPCNPSCRNLIETSNGCKYCTVIIQVTIY